MSSNYHHTIDDDYSQQLSRICSSYHRIDIHNIYKIINTLVYHLIYNKKFNDYPYKETMVHRVLRHLFKDYKDDKFYLILESYNGYIRDEIYKHKCLKKNDDDEQKRSTCCKNCL